jgi:hypothetical protein
MIVIVGKKNQSEQLLDLYSNFLGETHSCRRVRAGAELHVATLVS